MQDKKFIPVENIHDVHHPQAWFEHLQHNDFFYGHMEMQDKPDSVDYQQEAENHEYETIHQDNYRQTYGSWSGFDFHG